QAARMQVHLVDGTYELFRSFYSPRGGHTNGSGEEVGATRGVLRSVLSLLDDGVTHIGVATDHVIESFRNDLWPGYKTGEGIDPLLHTQFPWLEDALEALGVTVWPMVEVEADDALAAAAALAAADDRVERVVICTPDKDLAQCVVGDRVVQFDRRAGVVRDAAGVLEKYGVEPASIPDWLALVGDSADGFPGLPGWGAKSAAAVLRTYGTVEAIPHAPGQWDVPGLRGAAKLAVALSDGFEHALLFKTLATLVTDLDVGAVDEWRWTGPTEELAGWCDRLDAPDVLRKAERLAEAR
ncbi:MAG: 5'-3' exonuclease, partial [Microthrixaceae bacterium]